jgi:(S)-sulfolactate dehydrogenase
MMKILICEFMDGSAVQFLRRRFDTRYDPDLVDRREELFAALQDADALIVRNRTQVNAELLAVAPKLRVVGRLGVGLDNIDLAASRARQVAVIPATGANAAAVAEYVVCAAMMLLRGAYRSSTDVASGGWPRAALSDGREIGGKLIGIVGFGGIGRLTARLARSLGMRVLACDPLIAADSPIWQAEETSCLSLEGLLAQADVVSLHIPLSPGTRNLIGAAQLALMKSDAVLINTARGGTVDETALAIALRAGRLGGAALDVFAGEPLASGSPLADCPNLILTPHIAGVTREANQRVSSMIAEQVAALLESA